MKVVFKLLYEEMFVFESIHSSVSFNVNVGCFGQVKIVIVILIGLCEF